MNEWFKRLIEQLKNVWSQWKPVQKVIFFGVIGVALLGIGLLITFSASPTTVPLLTTPITDQELLTQITTRLDQEGVSYTLSEDNRILMTDEATAQRMRSILAREDLIPPETDPWELF
ncbi:MAG: flagellar M-ring protein FliF, partial [Alkalispirochaetaceae bacterium]